jgi:4-amino-4-deoxy-L-arabinose transferase-like glycosyltransferase
MRGGRLPGAVWERVRTLPEVVGRSPARRAAAVVVALCLLSLPLFYQLGRWPLLEPDEGRNAEVAREMLAQGSWIVPSFNGLPYLDKPVLLFWMIAGAFRAVGIGEVGARLPAAGSAVALLVLTFLIARALLGTRGALLATVVTGTTPLFLIFGRLTIFDMPLTLLVTFALWCLLKARSTANVVAWFVLAGVAMGLGTLAKGPVGVVVPVVAWAAARGALPKPDRPTGWRPLLAGALAVVAIVTPWVVSVEYREPGFLRYVLLEETVHRVTSAERFARREPFYYHFVVLLVGLGVWSAVLVAVGPVLARRRHAGGPDQTAIRFAARAAGAIVLLFSVIASKRPGYTLPAIVPIGILVAAGIVAAPRRAAAGAAAYAGVAVVVGLLTLGFLEADGWSWLTPSPRVEHWRETLQPTMAAGAVVLLVLGLMALAALAAHPALVLAVAGLSGPCLYVSLLEPLGPWVETRSTRRLVERVGSNADVVAYLTFRPSLPFYLRRPVPLFTREGKGLGSNYVIARADALTGRDVLLLPKELGARIRQASSLYILTNRWEVEALRQWSPRVLHEVFDDDRNLLVVTGPLVR